MILDAIKERFSVRNFENKEIPDTLIKEVLEAARLAPSWMNIQSWHFIVVKNQETKQMLADLSQGQKHVANAPVVIVCCGAESNWYNENFSKMIRSWENVPKERTDLILSSSAFNPSLKGLDAITLRTIEQETYALAYMTIQAEASGLGACVIGAMGNELTGASTELYKKVREKLNIPEGMIVTSLLTLGYVDKDKPKPVKKRKSFDEIVSYEKFGQKKEG